ncbi:MAG: TRAP transporter substrate-binding protein [Deltaproteobacteria bacterium]|nr:MAG: TRAP transporter substrate-binding protein [Deltaproteobacteria bacterium]
MNKKSFLVVLAALFLCGVVLPSMVWAINIRFNVMYSPKHPLCREAFNPWAEEVAKVTDGRVKVTMFYSSALFKVKQAYDAVATRVGDMGLVLPTYERNRFLVSSVLDLPMVAHEKAKINSEVLWEMYQTFPEIRNDYSEVKVLWAYMNPAFQLHFTKKQVRNLEELKDTVVSAGGTVNARIMKSLGASVEAIPMVQVYLALQKGVVEGCFLPYAPLRSQRMADLLHYHTDANLMAVSFFVVINKDVWSKISPEDQKAIEKISGLEGARRVGTIFDKYQVKDTKWMAEKGDKFFPLDPAEREKWAKRILPIRNEWIQDVKVKGVNGERLLATGLKLMSEKSK